MYCVSITFVNIENKWELYDNIWVDWSTVISNRLETIVDRGRNYLLQRKESNTEVKIQRNKYLERLKIFMTDSRGHPSKKKDVKTNTNKQKTEIKPRGWRKSSMDLSHKKIMVSTLKGR